MIIMNKEVAPRGSTHNNFKLQYHWPWESETCYDTMVLCQIPQIFVKIVFSGGCCPAWRMTCILVHPTKEVNIIKHASRNQYSSINLWWYYPLSGVRTPCSLMHANLCINGTIYLLFWSYICVRVTMSDMLLCWSYYYDTNPLKAEVSRVIVLLKTMD